MAAALAVVSLGRAARTSAGVKVRQPLSRMIASASTAERLAALHDPHLRTEIEDELNVKELVVVDRRAGYADVTLKPNLPVLGPRLGKRLGRLREALKNAGVEAATAIEEGRTVDIPLDGETVTLGPGDVLVECVGKSGYAVAAERGWFVALDVTLDEALELEGLARETLNRIQAARKDLGLAVTDRIRVLAFAEGRLAAALERHARMLESEALITKLDLAKTPPEGAVRADVDGLALLLRVEKTS
jgi:isoleucyl-tRNA synthetase